MHALADTDACDHLRITQVTTNYHRYFFSKKEVIAFQVQVDTAKNDEREKNGTLQPP